MVICWPPHVEHLLDRSDLEPGEINAREGELFAVKKYPKTVLGHLDDLSPPEVVDPGIDNLLLS